MHAQIDDVLLRRDAVFGLEQLSEIDLAHKGLFRDLRHRKIAVLIVLENVIDRFLDLGALCLRLEILNIAFGKDLIEQG